LSKASTITPVSSSRINTTVVLNDISSQKRLGVPKVKINTFKHPTP
jgi:hypothetical protein